MKSILALPNFYQRLIVGSGLAFFLALSLTYSHTQPWDWLFFIPLALISTIALQEFYTLAKRVNHTPLVALGLLTSILSLLAWFLGFSPILILLFAFVGAIFFYLQTQQTALATIAITFFGLLYITLPMALLLDIQFAPEPSTSFWTILIIVATKGADIFAYLVGKTFGKHMLCPRLSPKKTVEGALGGLLGSTIITWLLIAGDPLERVALGLVMGFFAIAGDLFESIFKRDAQLKDSGHIPGLGGALDLIDSLLFTTPVVYLYLVSQEII